MSISKYLAALLLAVSVSFGFNNAIQAEEGAEAFEEIHRLVIQVNSDSMDVQDHVLSNIVNLQKHYGLDNIEIEVVAYGPGIWMVTDKSNFASRVESLMMQNVVFTACGNTMDAVEAKSGSRPTLLDDVETTKAGIARIMELQEQGWSYLSP